MKKATLLCGMLLAITATVASAGPGVNLKWDRCLGDGGTLNKAFACNKNTGTNTLVGSFELGTEISAATGAQASGLEIVVDLASGTPTLPAWWTFKNAGTCRTNSLGMDKNAGLALAVNCIDWSNNQATIGIGAYNIGA